MISPEEFSLITSLCYYFVSGQPLFMLILKCQLQVVLLYSVPGVLPCPLLIGQDTDS